MTFSQIDCGVDYEQLNEQTTLLERQQQQSRSKLDQLFYSRLKLYAAIFCANLAFQILAPTQTKIYETIYCEQWYHENKPSFIPANGEIPEQLCKITPVQSQVASLKGWLEFYDSIPGLVLAIPFGILADILGRRPLILVNLTIVTLQQFWIAFVMASSQTIPLRAIYLEAILNIFSGGKIVAEMLLVCIITDVTPREKLSIYFFRFNAIGQLTRVLGPVLAASLMHRNAWWAVWIGLGFLVIVVSLAATIPETLRKVPSDEVEEEIRDNRPGRLKAAMKMTFDAFKELAVVWTDWRLLFLVLLYPFRMMGMALGDLMQRYVSNRYNWSLADATFLNSLQAVAATFVLFAVLPISSDFVERVFKFSPIQMNVVMARIALFMLMTAYALEGYAPGIPLLIFGLCIETFGMGLSSNLRALAGVLVEQKDNGRVFSVLAISESMSNMLAYPLTAKLFNIGLEHQDGKWLGLPFFVTAAAAAVALIAMFLARFERTV